MLLKLRNIVSSRGGRISAGLSAQVSLLWLLWPSQDWSLDIEKAVAFVAALGAWLWSELDGLGEPHPHDIQLFQKLQGTIGPDERRALIRQDMAEPFPKSMFDGTREVCDTWEGSAYEFHDRVINNSWKQLHNALFDFRMKIAQHTVPSYMDTSFAIVISPDGPPVSFSCQDNDYADQLNCSAKEAAKIFDEFERLARSRLRV